MRRYYNKGSLVGGQVKLDKMGNNDGKISGEDFAVMRSRKMGGGMMKRPMYKAGSANPKAKSKTSMKQAKAGMESQKPVTKKVLKKLNPFNNAAELGKKGFKKMGEFITKKIEDSPKFKEMQKVKKANGGMMEEAKDINSKIKNSRTLKMGGGMMKRNMYKAGGSDASKFHTKKDGTKARKGLYYYMNRAKKKGTSKPGKGTVTDKALKASAKTAKKPTKKA